MILRFLIVEGWRCFVTATALGPFGDGLNVIHGPNGVGKSTLMWAMARGFFDNHAVTGYAVRSLQPWGRDLNPTVTLEFEQEEERYRLTKRFLSGPISRLSRFEDGDRLDLARCYVDRSNLIRIEAEFSRVFSFGRPAGDLARRLNPDKLVDHARVQHLDEPNDDRACDRYQRVRPFPLLHIVQDSPVHE